MACLSISRDGVFVICASPIFVTSRVDLTPPGSALKFEVFAADATSLKPLIGQIECFMLDPAAPFMAELTTLEPCESTHAGLRLMRDAPTVRGVLTIQGEV
jgi:hypothetical protein